MNDIVLDWKNLKTFNEKHNITPDEEFYMFDLRKQNERRTPWYRRMPWSTEVEVHVCDVFGLEHVPKKGKQKSLFDAIDNSAGYEKREFVEIKTLTPYDWRKRVYGEECEKYNAAHLGKHEGYIDYLIFYYNRGDADIFYVSKYQPQFTRNNTHYVFDSATYSKRAMSEIDRYILKDGVMYLREGERNQGYKEILREDYPEGVYYDRYNLEEKVA